jgi:ATP-dependent Clp protease adaptor protein ClpS
LTQHDQQGDVATKQREETEVDEPDQYKVIFHNDDYTTMDFVVKVLETIFRKSPAEATEIMLTVHRKGREVAGIYDRQVAETKVHQTTKLARKEGHPLKVTMEPE